MSHAARLADWLDDMLTAARQACSYVEGMERDEFLADRRTQQAVAMNLLIVGEAAAKALEHHSAALADHPQIPWSSMKGMRNRIAHGYFELNFSVVWETVDRALPELVTALPSVIAELRGECAT